MKVKMTLLMLMAATWCHAQQFSFDLTGNKKVAEGSIAITETSVYNDELGYGYDLQKKVPPRISSP